MLQLSAATGTFSKYPGIPQKEWAFESKSNRVEAFNYKMIA